MAPAPLPHGLGATFWSIWEGSVERLGDGEAWIGGYEGVGLYEGNNKVPGYQNMVVHLTTHRLLLVPDTGTALQAPLSAVRQTEFYAGFMRSSAKITLTLGWPKPDGTLGAAPPSASASASASTTALVPPSARSTPQPQLSSQPEPTWTCGVCGFANPLPHGTAVGPHSKCALCGVAYAMSRTMSPPPSRPASAPVPAAVSLPRAETPASLRSHPERVATPPQPPPAPRTPTGEQIPCPACTFLNHASMTECEICGTGLPRLRKRDLPGGKDEERAKPAKPAERENDTVRLSFRKGREREAYKRLKGVLSDKVWERVAAPKPRTGGAGGIDAIIKNLSLDAQAHDAGMQDAFRDLEVLMVRAGEMVRLAQSLNAKLTAAGEADAEEATLVRSSLVQLGLPAPALTQDMVRDERAYLDGLAKELGHLLTGRKDAKGESGLMLQPGRGVVALDTVWGLWMRARGIALLPPSTLTQLLPLLPPHTDPPIRPLSLPSGLQVLYAPLYAPRTLARRIVHRISPREDAPDPDSDSDPDAEIGLSIIEVAAAEGLPIGLATELLDLVTGQGGEGGIVRDEQAGPSDGGVRYYRDIISAWPLGLQAA